MLLCKLFLRILVIGIASSVIVCPLFAFCCDYVFVLLLASFGFLLFAFYFVPCCLCLLLVSFLLVASCCGFVCFAFSFVAALFYTNSVLFQCICELLLKGGGSGVGAVCLLGSPPSGLLTLLALPTRYRGHERFKSRILLGDIIMWCSVAQSPVPGE